MRNENSTAILTDHDELQAAYLDEPAEILAEPANSGGRRRTSPADSGDGGGLHRRRIWPYRRIRADGGGPNRRRIWPRRRIQATGGGIRVEIRVEKRDLWLLIMNKKQW